LTSCGYKGTFSNYSHDLVESLLLSWYEYITTGDGRMLECGIVLHPRTHTCFEIHEFF
jgi:hypothetical protein